MKMMTEFDYIRRFEDMLGESPMGFSADVRMGCAFVEFSMRLKAIWPTSPRSGRQSSTTNSHGAGCLPAP